MKIREISCDQFAGLRLDDPLSFSDGINVVYGKNESGKSTLVNLISELLFRNTEFGRGVGKKEFERLYFPVGSQSAGDSADGKIVLATEDGDYTLSKVWGAGSACSLKTPEVTKRDAAGIQEELKRVLVYGKGVYSQMLLSPQKDTDQVLKDLLDASGSLDAKEEITDVVSRTFSQSGSVSADALERKIDSILFGDKDAKETLDKNGLASGWNSESDAPVKTERQKIGIGYVLQAYYNLEDAKEEEEILNRLISDADQASENCLGNEEAEKKAEEAYNRYRQISEQLMKEKDLRDKVAAADKDLNRWKEIVRDWPGRAEWLEKAGKLADEQGQRNNLDLYGKACECRNEAERLKEALENKLCPEAQEIRQVKDALKRIREQESSLCDMNIRALVYMSGNYKLEVTSLRTGEPVDITAPIREAVRMKIQDVVEMELAPADVNVAEVQGKIAADREIIRMVHNKYGTDDPDKLDEMRTEAEGMSRAREDRGKDLDRLLGDRSFYEQREVCEAITGSVRTAEEIRNDIRTLCGTGNLNDLIVKTGTILEGYEKEYGSVEKLGGEILAREAEQKGFEGELADLPDIPEEYRDIGDPQQYLTRLETAFNSARVAHEEAKNKKMVAISRLEDYQETHPEDPAEKVENREREFREYKEKLASWLLIRSKLEEQKKTIREHPLEDLAGRFTEYLGILSGGRIASEQPDADKLNLRVLSGRRPLGYDLLSEGTKDTVSLAFRLAVVDHLFPEGGGVIVLDDPLTDMDEDRVEQACRLIRECAKRHQVIFLTCREEYQDRLEGNLIPLGS